MWWEHDFIGPAITSGKNNTVCGCMLINMAIDYMHYCLCDRSIFEILRDIEGFRMFFVDADLKFQFKHNVLKQLILVQ